LAGSFILPVTNERDVRRHRVTRVPWRYNRKAIPGRPRMLAFRICHDEHQVGFERIAVRNHTVIGVREPLGPPPLWTSATAHILVSRGRLVQA